MIFRLTNKRILQVSSELIIFGIILISTIIYLQIELNPADLKNILVLYGSLIFLYLVVYFIPFYRLFSNYYNHNKETILVFNENGITIDGKSIEMPDIKQIDIFANKMHFRGEGGKLPYQDFYYLKLILNNNKSYILTSLLNQKIEKEFKKKYPDLLYNENLNTFPLVE